MRLRTRRVPYEPPDVMGKNYVVLLGKESLSSTQYYPTFWDPYVMDQTTEDELHPGPPWKSGGPFDSTKVDTDQFEVKGHLDQRVGMRKYVGSFIPATFPSSYVTEDVLDWDDEVRALGPEAWNRFKPTRPRVNFGVTSVEFRELPRTLATTARGYSDAWKTMYGSKRLFAPKELANHWLNSVFGWIPFLSDLRAFYRTCKNIDRLMNQLKRDNGQWVKRSGTLRNESSAVVEKSDELGLMPALATQHYTGSPYGKKEAIITTSKEVWFSGRFRYWIPDTGPFKWEDRAYAILFGMRASPSLLWELTPWSWLIDWCSSVGDTIDNLTSILYDGLCAKYAYVMGTKTCKCQYTGTANFVSTGPYSLTWEYALTRKVREAASPFGFGLVWPDLTAKQLSILTALGISRIPPV